MCVTSLQYDDFAFEAEYFVDSLAKTQRSRRGEKYKNENVRTLLLAAVTSLFLLTGCGSNKNGSSTPKWCAAADLLQFYMLPYVLLQFIKHIA